MALRRRETETFGNDTPVDQQEHPCASNMRRGSQPESTDDNDARDLSIMDEALARRLVRQHRAVYDYLADR